MCEAQGGLVEVDRVVVCLLCLYVLAEGWLVRTQLLCLHACALSDVMTAAAVAAATSSQTTAGRLVAVRVVLSSSSSLTTAATRLTGHAAGGSACLSGTHATQIGCCDR